MCTYGRAEGIAGAEKPHEKKLKEKEKKMRSLKKNKKKGFTLVELIVVLVILAILAALLIPALVGYIDKAKEKRITAETRQIVMAAQTLVDEEYAKLKGAETVANIQFTTSTTKTDLKVRISDIQTLSEISPLTIGTSGNVAISIATTGHIDKVEYINQGMKCTYDSSTKAYKVEKPSTGLSFTTADAN